MRTRVAVLVALVALGAASAADLLFKVRPEVDVVADALAVASPGQDRAALSSAILDVLADHFRQGQLESNNATGFAGMCCTCNRCQRRCQQCGKSCCCKGDQGCSCVSCVSSRDKAFQFEGESIKMLTWEERVKVVLRQKVAAMTGLPDNKLALLDGVVDTYVTFLQ